jgi:hypothetical protein
MGGRPGSSAGVAPMGPGGRWPMLANEGLGSGLGDAGGALNGNGGFRGPLLGLPII